MANQEIRYRIKTPKETPEQFWRNCYIDLAKKTSSIEAISNLQMSETVQMPTVGIRHNFWVDADYTAEVGRQESETTVVEETHKYEDGASYTEEVTRETKFMVWDPHEGHIKNVKLGSVILLEEIDMSSFYEGRQKKGKLYWQEKGWTYLDPQETSDGWMPASEDIVEKLAQVPFDVAAYEQNLIDKHLAKYIGGCIPAGYIDCRNIEAKPEVVRSVTIIGLQIDYRVSCEYKGHKFHIPVVGKEMIPLPTQGNVKKEFKSKASTFNFTARKEWLRNNHPDYHKNRKLKEKMLLLMPAAGLLGIILTMVASNILFLLLGAAGAAGAWFMYKRANAAMTKIEEEASQQATQEYQKLKEEEAAEIAEHSEAFENLKEKKIEALNAVFTKKGMQPLSEEEMERL